MNEEKQTFEYTYSAKEQAEIKKIREKYVAPQKPEISKMEQLRRLDASVTKKGSIASLIVGIIGSLIMGSGMSLVMTDLAQQLGLQHAIPIGIAVGVVGMVMVILAYPIYLAVTKKERKRVAPEILRLTNELMK